MQHRDYLCLWKKTRLRKIKERRMIITRNDLLWIYISLRFDKLILQKYNYGFSCHTIREKSVGKVTRTKKSTFSNTPFRGSREKYLPSSNINPHIISRNFFLCSINRVVTRNWLDGPEKGSYPAIGFLVIKI